MGYFEYFKIFVTPESITIAVILVFGIIYRSIILPRLKLLEEYEASLGDKLKSILPPDELVILIKKATPTDMLEVLLNSVNNVNKAITDHNKSKMSHGDLERIVQAGMSGELRRLVDASKKDHNELKFLLGILLIESQKVDLTKALEIIAKVDTLLKLYRNAQHTEEAQ